MDIFISYKKEEKAFAARMSRRLREAGFSVWWDAALLSGEPFQDEIKTAIEGSKAVIILWSRKSVRSKWVVAEASKASSLDKALPVIIDDLPHDKLPLLFEGLHCPSLATWRGEPGHKGFTELLAAVRTKVGEPGSELSQDEAEADLETSEVEAQVWAEIRNAAPQRADEYRDYLERYGEDGRFAEIARLRIKRLERREPRITRLSIVLAALLIVSTVLLTASLIRDDDSGQTMLGRAVDYVRATAGLSPPPEPLHYYDIEYGFELSVPADLKAPPAPVGGNVSVFQSDSIALVVSAGENQESSFAAQIERSRDATRDRGWQLDGDPEIAADLTLASYKAAKGDRLNYVRLISLCRGLQHAAFSLEYPRQGSYQFMLSQISQSMRSTGAGVTCPNPKPETGFVRTSDDPTDNPINLFDAPGGNVIGRIANLTPVKINGVKSRLNGATTEWWYDLTDIASPLGGWAGSGNIKIDQYIPVVPGRQFIQVGSDFNRDNSEVYARTFDPPLDLYLAVNGAYAATWPETFDTSEAAERLRGMTQSNTIPAGAALRIGNSYVMRVCC